MSVSRRSVLAAAAVAVAKPQPASAALDLTKPANKLEVYARMRGNADAQLSLWWWKANVWAKMHNDIAKILCLVEGLTFQRITRNADGTLDQKMTGRGTFRDAQTGGPLTNWVNPDNGHRAKPDHVVSLNHETITADGIQREQSDRVVAFEGGISNPEVVGNNVYLTENFVVKSRTATPGEYRTGSSLTVFTGDAAAMADDNAIFRPCNFNYQSPGSFRPWMGYDNGKGILTWQTVGQKLRRGVDDAPDGVRGWVEATYPGFLENPPI